VDWLGIFVCDPHGHVWATIPERLGSFLDVVDQMSRFEILICIRITTISYS